MKHLYPYRGRHWSVYVLFFLLFCIQNAAVLAQNVSPTLRGVVLSANGQEPLAGASIQIKGTTHGTLSNARGQFSLAVTDNKIGLRVSFIGYYTLDTLVTPPFTKELVLSLRPDESVLEEITVSTGYWESSKRLSTGNISKINAETIEKQPVTNVLQAVQGRMPGVYITQRSGVPGGGFNIEIRGQNSLRADGNAPYYLVDGVPFPPTTMTQIAASSVMSGGNPLNTLHPSDIESIEILKDADATAIYGSKGANGVVIIRTKRGIAGKTKFELNLSSGNSRVGRKVALLNTSQYIAMRKEAYANDKVAISGAAANDLLVWGDERDTDWQDFLIGGTANTVNAQGSLSGGSASTRFLIRGSYHKEGSVFPGDFKYGRGSGLVSLNHSSEDKKLKLQLSVNYATDQNNLPQTDFTRDALRLPPNAPAVYNSEGALNWENGTFNNPLQFLATDYHSKTESITANTQIEYRIVNNLHFKTNLGWNKFRYDERNSSPGSSRNPATGITTNESTFATNDLNSWIVEPQLEYRVHSTRSSFSVLAGSTVQQEMRNGQGISATGFGAEALMENIVAASTVLANKSSYSLYRYSAFFARINYNFNEKLILNLTGRKDGSSRFGSGNQIANFGAIGVAWIISQEPFLVKNLPFISFAKLRSSFGITGSDQIGDYGYLDGYKVTSPYLKNGLVAARLANPDYSWETNKKLEIALEASLFRGRASIETSWYTNRSSNQLVGLPLPATTGFTSIQFNLPATVQNTGWEMEIQTLNLNSNDFSWKTGFNVSIPRTKLISYPNLSASAYRDQYIEGKSMNISFKYESLGVNPETGLYSVLDVNNDGVYSIENDAKKIMNSGMQFHGGFQNTFKYKSVELGVMIHLVNQIVNDHQVNFPMPGTASNQPVEVMQRWQKPGDNMPFQKFTRGSTATHTRFNSSDAMLKDFSFARLKNVSLSWILPKIWISKLSVDNCRLYLQCQNLLTLTRYKGLDPENRSTAYLPPLKTITTGINVSF